ncbi:MAG: ribose 5-phosphate isomerase B [Rhodospirillales bacterium]|nr:ribose 5-phosphate isomerase B [Rhodospirillales bacterium]
MTQTVALAADHGGVELKALLVKDLVAAGLSAVDLGTNSADSVDYPDYADRLAAALKDGRAARGILICGTGIGISIAANRHKHIRAALCHDETTARLCREHNDANVLVLGARVIGPEVARACLNVFLSTKFGGGRHIARVAKLG